MPRPQSLAKMMAFESNSHTGDVLLQFPPVRSCTVPLVTLRSQICFGPLRADSNTAHLPSGELTESLGVMESGKYAGAALRVEGSNAIVVEAPCVTSSK